MNNPDKLESVLDTLRGSREHFREILTDASGILRMVCRYAEKQALRKHCEPWVIISQITGHGSGVSAAIYELYR